MRQQRRGADPLLLVRCLQWRWTDSDVWLADTVWPPCSTDAVKGDRDGEAQTQRSGPSRDRTLVVVDRRSRNQARAGGPLLFAPSARRAGLLYECDYLADGDTARSGAEHQPCGE